MRQALGRERHRGHGLRRRGATAAGHGDRRGAAARRAGGVRQHSQALSGEHGDGGAVAGRVWCPTVRRGQRHWSCRRAHRGIRPARHAGRCHAGGRHNVGDAHTRWWDDGDGRGSGVTTVLLVDDHPVVREGLRGMIDAEHDLTVVGEAGSGAEAIALADSLRPDVILMDLRMADVDGVTATERILAALPRTRIVVVTTYESDTDILRAVEAGAAGYLLKDASRAELAEAVRDAARGKTVLAPTVADRLVHFVRQPTSVTLSTREVEVLSHVAKGKTNAEIGQALHISEATVKTHLLRVFNKLDVSDRTAAVTTAMSLGVL